MLSTWGLVDVFCRRHCFTAGLLLNCITHIYRAIYAALWIGSADKPTSDVAIASVGLCTVQCLYGTEIHPTRARMR